MDARGGHRALAAESFPLKIPGRLTGHFCSRKNTLRAHCSKS
jgi:hypothetical protein